METTTYPTQNDIMAILGRLSLKHIQGTPTITNLLLEDAEYLDAHRLLHRSILLPFIRDKMNEVHEGQDIEMQACTFFNCLVDVVERTLALRKSA